jgi:hypothetical protein
MLRRVVVVAFVALLAGAPGVIGGQEATPVASGTVLPPEATVGGLTLGEWHARYVQWYVGLLVGGVTTYETGPGTGVATVSTARSSSWTTRRPLRRSSDGARCRAMSCCSSRS